MSRRVLLLLFSVLTFIPNTVLAIPVPSQSGGGGNGGGGQQHQGPVEPEIRSDIFPSKLDRNPTPPHWADLSPNENLNALARQQPGTRPFSDSPHIIGEDWSDRFPIPMTSKKLLEFRNIQCTQCVDECTRYHAELQDPTPCIQKCTATLQRTFQARLADIPLDLLFITRHMNCIPDDHPDAWINRREPSSPQPSQPWLDGKDGPLKWMSRAGMLGKNLWMGTTTGVLKDGKLNVNLPPMEKWAGGLMEWAKGVKVPPMRGSIPMGGGGRIPVWKLI